MLQYLVEAVSLNLGLSVELFGVVGDTLLKHLPQLSENPSEILVHLGQHSAIEQLHHFSLQGLSVESLKLLLCKLVLHPLLESLNLCFD